MSERGEAVDPGDARQAEAAAETQSAKNAASRNVVVSLGARAFYLVSRLFLPPIVLAYVSLELYGIWAACFVVIGYIGMSSFGISNVYIRYVADYHARGETEKINALVTTGMAVVGAFAAVLLPILWYTIPWIVSAFQVSEAHRQTAFWLFFGTAAIFLVDMVFSAFSDVLTGLQRIALTQGVWIATATGEAVLVVVLLVGGLGVYSLLIAYVARTLVSHASSLFFFTRALPGLSVHPRHFDPSILGVFWRFGSVVQLSGLLGMALRSIEKVLAGVTLGPASTALFEVGEKLPMMATSISSSMNGVLFPMATYLHGKDRGDQMRKLYLKGSRYLAIVTGIMTGFMPGFAALLMTAWLGAEEAYDDAIVIMMIFALPWHLNVLTGPASAIFRGIERPKLELVYPFAQLVVVALCVTGAFMTVGPSIVSISVAVAAGMVTSALAYMAFANRVVGIPQGSFLRLVVLPGLVPYAVGVAVGAATQPLAGWALVSRWNALQTVALGGVAYVGLCGVVILFALTEWGEREYLRAQITHTLGGMLRLGRRAD